MKAIIGKRTPIHYPQSTHRRGVLLLLILALLSMFGLIAVAFVVISGQARRSAKSVERIERVSDPPQKVLQQAAMQVFRGSTSPASVMGAHGLLEDIYGVNTVQGQIHGNDLNSTPQTTATGGAQMRSSPLLITTTASTWPTGGQLIWIQVHNPAVPNDAVAARCVGRVLTMMDGPAKGQSTRIVAYDGANDRFHLVAFGGQTIRASDGWVQVNGTEFSPPGSNYNYVINGAPFSGTGFGYDTTTGALDYTLGVSNNNDTTLVNLHTATPTLTTRWDWELALLPNAAQNKGMSIPPGGANEDYDAADFQNTLLAAQVYNNTTGRIDTLPSFHRSALINFWYHRLYSDIDWTQASPAVTTPTEKWKMILWPSRNAAVHDQRIVSLILDLKRKISMRPLVEDHPNFTGSNPSSTLVPTGFAVTGTEPNYFWERGDVPTAQWDIDNDGDGVTDSVWVDLGMPVRSTTDGRMYKPLFAILCTDLDGRLNLNAHGNVAQSITGTVPNPILSTGASADQLFQNKFVLAGPATSPPPRDFILPQRGLGFGPAEINLSPVCANAVGNPLPLVYQNLLGVHWDHPTAPTDPIPCNVALGLDGRFGQLPLLNFTTRPADVDFPKPGVSNNNVDPLNSNKWFEFAGNVNGSTGTWPWYWWRFLNMTAIAYERDSYGSPPDPNGQGAIGLDVAGRPLYLNTTGSVADSPYETNLNPNVSRGLTSNTATNNNENPFSLAELERILRPYDRDANALPSRLAKLTSTDGLPQNSTLLLNNRRLKVTTESWDLPCPNQRLSTEANGELNAIRNALNLSKPGLMMDLGLNSTTTIYGPVDLLKARLAFGIANTTESIPPYSPPYTNAQIIEIIFFELQSLISPELLAGLKMDINRPFGNGRDYNTTKTPDDNTSHPGIVDAPATPDATKRVTQYFGPTPADKNNYAISCDESGTPADPLLARQLEARYLYVLMFLLARDDIVDAFGGAGHEEEAAQAVAQWAVNVVDFRDRDNIMTPFDYDPNFAYKSNDAMHLIYKWQETKLPQYRVWGCEKPELLITETLAFHDRRSDNTTSDSTGQKKGTIDTDFDQLERPQGSLFVELYNPAGPLDPPVGLSAAVGLSKPEHDNAIATQDVGCVRLNQTAPAPTGSPPGTPGAPVWRLAIVNKSEIGKDPDATDPAKYPTAIERSIYFANPSLVIKPASRIGQKYYPSSPNTIAPLLPGRYAVIGPGTTATKGTTYVGEKIPGPTTRRIDLDETISYNNQTNFQVQVLRNRITSSPNNEIAKLDTANPTIVHIKPPVAVVIDQCIGKSGASLPDSRLSVSEPIDGYTPSDQVTATLDHPLDDTGNPDPDVKKIGTTLNHCEVHLQRLANPRKPYNMNLTTATKEMQSPADYNPYITIDSQPVDLTVFNGLDATEFATQSVLFASRQRGETNNVVTDGSNNLWKSDITTTNKIVPNPSTATGDGTHVFDYVLQHTLGYLNYPFFSAATPKYPRQGDDPTTKLFSYRGDLPDAVDTFPWLTWNNRPYVSPMELLYMPAVRSSQLLKKFNTAQPGNPYMTDIKEASFQNSPFPHLLSLFKSNELNVADSTKSKRGSQFYRILDYLRVPSPFACAETQINPTILDPLPPTVLHNFHTPFNRISNYREPGRININTIYDPEVFDGLKNFFPYPLYGTAPNNDIWSRFVWSRRGYSNVGGAQNSVLVQDIACPTEFAKPFRSFAGASLRQPLTSLETCETNISGQPLIREINGTLLRTDPADAAKPPTLPLFRYDNIADAAVNTDRNPFFHYQGLERLGNLVTTRSNVYAVWITVGYFEVTPAQAPYDVQIYPDGYQLGRELGTDTGEIERHRAFYIFDRSLPVGFQRGQDMNVEKAILVNRYIE